MSDLTLVQLTDTHLRPAGESVPGGVDTYANLIHALDRVRAAGDRIDALILSGDLADSGAPAAYRRLRAAVEPVAAELGAAVVYAMGNHDERIAFGVELLGIDCAAADSNLPHDDVTWVSGLRIITLDSTTPHRHDGRLEPGQLIWLREQLRTPAPRGTLLVLHHPPIPSANPATEMLKLQQPEQLAAVVADSDVRMIVCGHNHLTAAAALAGVPVWIGPALAYRLDPMAPAGRHRGLAGFGFSRIDVIGSTFLATAIEATPAAVVYERPQVDVLAELATLAGEG
ncbi:metallophosphoesterase [Nocardia pseudobrasiliensis]|uniref:3',5'-cyclic AMP phosphodiesterase CpdA n=1 Tax=Nocardia pseudobrasiliensis TaxID=45979 RepID=A0A370IAR1_9NOCA|nr:metallophosphoesterase [Nocardia pseudobrasiliensis]RDI67221.1 3',5'-cyclic AMP phosphodiesterase CpdA [Nocardia pseudobrasiliensis]